MRKIVKSNKVKTQNQIEPVRIFYYRYTYNLMNVNSNFG